MNLLRGQRFKLEQVGVNSKLKLEVDMVLNSNLELDMSCFGVDENDNLLYIWSNNVNESLQILAAKNYIENTIGSDKIQIVYGKK